MFLSRAGDAIDKVRGCERHVQVQERPSGNSSSKCLDANLLE